MLAVMVAEFEVSRLKSSWRELEPKRVSLLYYRLRCSAYVPSVDRDQPFCPHGSDQAVVALGWTLPPDRWSVPPPADEHFRLAG